MGYSTLKAALDAVVKTNGRQQITGSNLNGVMTTILQGVDLLDRANPADTSGKNCVVLKKNKTFAEQVTGANTIYEIRDNFDLGGASVAILAGCILKFNGGKVSNGTITGNNTQIDSCGCLYFIDGVTFDGSWANSETSSEWFAQSISAFHTIVTNLMTLTMAGGHITISRNTTLSDVTDSIEIVKSLHFDFTNHTLTLQERDQSTSSIKRVFFADQQDAILKGLSLRNLNISATANITRTDSFAGQTSWWGFFYFSNVQDVEIVNVNSAHLEEGFKFAFKTGSNFGKRNIRIYGCSIQAKMGLMLFETENVIVDSCDFDNSDATTSKDHAIYCTKSQNVTIQNSTFKNALDAINLFNSAAGATWNDIENAYLLNNVFDNCRRAAAILYGRHIVVDGLVCKNKVSATTNFLWVNACEDVSVSGFFASETAISNNVGIDINGGKGTFIFKESNISAFTPFLGLSACTMDVVIRDCTFKYTGSSGDYSSYGVAIQTAATFKNKISVYNTTFDFADCSQGQYFFLNGDGSADNQVLFSRCKFLRTNTTTRLLFDSASRLTPNLQVEECVIAASLNIGAVTTSKPKYKDCVRVTGEKIPDQPFYKAETNANITAGLTPILTAQDAGYLVYDKTNNKVILWNGTAWVNLDGSALA